MYNVRLYCSIFSVILNGGEVTRKKMSDPVEDELNYRGKLVASFGFVDDYEVQRNA